MKDESGLSKNNSKSVRFRLRIQQEKEALEEMKRHNYRKWHTFVYHLRDLDED